MPRSSSSSTPKINKLDYHPPAHERSSLLPSHDSRDASRQPSYAGSFFEQVAEGILERDRQKMKREVVRYLSFAWSIVNCLCCGSITAYSLYGPLFQSRLHYSQLQVNIVSIVADLALYLPVPAWGYLCDRYGPAPPSLLAAVLFGVGYLLAAFAYRSGAPPTSGGDGWPFWVMVVAFVGVGMGTSCMYLSAVTTCAKNFGRGKHKGLALAVPIAAFGLSGMWQSQIGSRLLYEPTPDGRKGEVDVFRFFIFLGFLLLGVGLVGGATLRIVDEEELIDEAVEELEQSGLLDEDSFFQRAARQHGYDATNHGDLSDSQVDFLRDEAQELQLRTEEEKRKKEWLLNAETRRFLSDRTMWWLAAGFFLVTGPGEAFINNLGTIIGTLYSPTTSAAASHTSAATHVSVVAIASTLARLITGTLTDLVAPSAPAHQHHRGPHSLASSLASLPPAPTARLALSRVLFLLAFALVLSAGQALLASGLVQDHADRFWAVSALVGAGYGAVFSLTPIIISVVWGVENFGTNWGIVAVVPALGAAVWGLVYSAVYQSAAEGGAPVGGGQDALCYGSACYASTFWAMAASVWVACGLWLWAWRGPGGWARRGVAV